ncbi:MAG: protein kinase [Planctomycetes bacterium]|nr:protein kinase [Planctomycetota bacterium]
MDREPKVKATDPPPPAPAPERAAPPSTVLQRLEPEPVPKPGVPILVDHVADGPPPSARKSPSRTAETLVPECASPAPPGALAPPPAGAPSSGEHPTPERRFGRYRIDSELARGGMGVVYRAFDTQLERTVALKVRLGEDDGEPEGRERFRREGLLAARVQHPGIVPVYDVGEAEGKLYLTMELIEGESLATVLDREGALPPRVALRIARDAARALQHAHEHRLVHRDVKPGNLLLEPIGDAQRPARSDDTKLFLYGRTVYAFRVLLTDFGLAKEVGGQARLTQSGTALGTPLYMSPEQAAGEGTRVGPASDIYSLGAVLYELLSGKPPFTAPDLLQLLVKVRLSDPEPLRRQVPSLHPDLETIVARAMEKDPARRFASAAAFADDLDRYLAGEVILARPSTPLDRAWRVVRRNRERVAAIGAAVFLALLVTLYFTLGPVLRQARAEAAERRARAERSTDAARRLAEAEGALLVGDLERATEIAERLVDEYQERNRRGEVVRVPEALDLLARVERRRGHQAAALRHRYRAYRAAVGLPSGRGVLLKVANELLDAGRFEEALPLLVEVQEPCEGGDEDREPDRDAAADLRENFRTLRAEAMARLGLTRLGVMDFPGAFRDLGRALANPSLPAGLRAELGAPFAFVTAVAEPVTPPGPGRPQRPIDFDGDGRPDLVRWDGCELVVGAQAGGTFQERARLRLPILAAEPQVHIGRIPIAGDAPPTFWIAGQGSKGTRLLVVRWRGAGLELVSDRELDSGIGLFVCGDLDADGVPEFVFACARNLWLARWDAGSGGVGTPVLVDQQGLESNAIGLELADFDGDGRQDVALFAGKWSIMGARILRIPPGGTELVAGPITPLGNPRAVVRLDRQGVPPAFAVATGWDDAILLQLRHLRGAEAFDAANPPLGVHLLEPRPDLTFSTKPLFALARHGPSPGSSWVARLRTRAGDFLWCTLSQDGEPTRVQVLRLGGDGACVARMTESQAPGSIGGGLREAMDVDGDGFDEAAFDRGDRLAFMGSAPEVGAVAPRVGGATTTVPAAGAAPAPRRARDPRLDAAGAAERAGLPEESEGAYRDILDTAATLADTEAAAKGLLGSLSAQGKAAALLSAARAAAERFPALAQAVWAESLRLLDGSGDWGEASEAAARLTQVLELTPEARRKAIEDSRRLRSLKEMTHRVRLVGREAADVEWVATSPLPFFRRTDGSLLIYGSGESRDRLLTRFSGPWQAWRLSGRMAVLRTAWSVDLHLGLTEGEPTGDDPLAAGSDGLSIRCGGGTNFPMHTLGIVSETAEHAEAKLYHAEAPWGEAPFGFELFLAPHQQRLRARIREFPLGEPVRGASIGARPPTGAAWVGWTSTARTTASFRGVFRFDELELASSSGRVEPRPARLETSMDCLMRADGCWVSGKPEAARKLYDVAVRMGEEEWARDLALAKEQGTSPRGAAEAGGPARLWVAVDAPFYRGLLKAALGDAAGAEADLRAAWGRMDARCRHLLLLHAEALRETRPAETKALRAWWRGRLRGRRPEEWQSRAEETLRAFGGPQSGIAQDATDALQLLLDEVRVGWKAVVGVARVPRGGAAEASGLRAGDVVRAVEGRQVETAEALRTALGAGASAGLEAGPTAQSGKAVRLTVERGQRGLELRWSGGALDAELIERRVLQLERRAEGDGG